jgi:circadian clock protein KaiB
MKRPGVRAGKKRPESWDLRLYVADTSPRSLLAKENVLAFCERYLPGMYRLTIIDILKRPASACRAGIIATPTLIRTFPGPPKRLIGTLADSERVLSALRDCTMADEVTSWTIPDQAQTRNA